MALPVYVFDKAIGNIGKGNIRLGTDPIKAYLSNTTPNMALDIYRSDLPEIAAGNGYTAGGVTLTGVTFTERPGSPQGEWLLKANNFSWTASGGNIGPARYVAFYALGVGSPNEYLIGVWDYGATFTITNGNTFTFNVNATDGILIIKKG
jgi:hypothetical protein